jgi:Molybdate transporter of MFS superfamily
MQDETRGTRRYGLFPCGMRPTTLCKPIRDLVNAAPSKRVAVPIMLAEAYTVHRTSKGMRIAGNEFNRPELAGAFGDLGVFVPFVVGYITINRLDPQAVLLSFGLMASATGLYFRTPMPVQPMKAIVTVAVTHPETVTPAAIFVSAVVTGLLWLGMGASRAVTWLAALTSPSRRARHGLGAWAQFHPRRSEPHAARAGPRHRGDCAHVRGLVTTFLRLFPMPIVGVILFFGGIELATGVNAEPGARAERTVMAVTAGVDLWNMGAAYLTGLVLCYALAKGVVRLSPHAARR